MKSRHSTFKYFLLLFATFLGLFFCTTVKAENYYYENGYKYTLSLGKATIVAYDGSDTTLTVPSTLNGKTVVKIGFGAFSDNKILRSIVFPDTITSVDEMVFAGCENLQSIHYPEGVERIPFCTFAYCHNLTDVNIPSVKVIEDSAFRECSSLKYLDMPNVEILDRKCFTECTSLSKVGLHEGFKKVGLYSFLNCTSLQDISLPVGTQEIGLNAFTNCKSLRYINLPPTLTVLGGRAFSSSGLISAIIPSSVTHIDNSIFENCLSLEKVEYYGKKIPEFAFRGCTSLKDLIIGSEVSSIGYAPFEGTTQLETLQIPSTTQLTSDAFIDAEMLHTIYGVKNSPAEIAANNVGLNFVPVKDYSIKLDKKELTLYTVKGKNSAILKPIISGSTSTPTWNSSNTKVVQVNTAGKVTAKSTGTAYVTVILGNKSASCKITVKKPVLNLKKKSVTLKKGSSYTISYSAVPTGEITFKSSNTKYVTVNAKGKITARQKGSATVSIKCNGITQKIKVTVK